MPQQQSTSNLENTTDQEINAIIEQFVTPWEVRGEVIEGKMQAINYNKLIDQFGCQPITTQLIERFERISGKPAHYFIRRGIFFSHRDLEKILDYHEQGKPIYLYTGRGPSSESMHLGHMIPFIFCKYLQDVFGCVLVVQMSDDEKFLFKDLTLEETTSFAFDNAKDIISVGFDPNKTFIFANSQYVGHMFGTILEVQKAINFNQASSVFGFTQSDSLGMISYPATQIAPSFPTAFPHLFGNGVRDVPVLIPCAIDQDPYFRLARDIAPRLKFNKPASIYSSFFPALQGFGTKMSASENDSAIFMTDSADQIKSKVNKYAFSGGKTTVEEHRELGGNPDIDVSFQYLKFFMDDDAVLNEYYDGYKKGKILSSQMKAKCIQVLQNFVADFQAKRSSIDESEVSKFMMLPPYPIQPQLRKIKV